MADPKRSEEFYLRVFGGEVIRSGEPTIIQIANSWVVFICTYIYNATSGYGSDKLRLLPMLTNSALYWQEIFLENLKKMIVNLLIDLLGIISKMQFNLFETRFKCKICGKIFTTKPLLNKHRKEEHNK